MSWKYPNKKNEAICDESVSVIIPAYNVESSLARCIDSALSQGLKPTQIIVVNDGSDDNTREVATSYGDQIIYIEQQNQGQGAARNTGLKIATGRFIAFLDADDYWLQGFIRNCVDFLQEHDDVIAVSVGLIIKKWGKEHIAPSILVSGSKMNDPWILENFIEFWAEQDHVRTGSVLIRRKVIIKAGYQLADLRISQDLEYWGYLATFGKWGFIPEPLWVGDPRPAAAAKGWLVKYKTRRRFCPTVEQWQRRIVPRLREEDKPSFRIIKGRVAMSFAHSKILAGAYNDALAIAMKYREIFPAGQIANIMRLGSRSGTLVWRITCFLLRFRECLKGFLISFTHSVDTIFTKSEPK